MTKKKRDYIKRKNRVMAYNKVDQIISYTELSNSKTSSIIWTIITVVEALLILRWFFLFFGARPAGFVWFIYEITAVFIAPFQGVYPIQSINNAYFDTAAILAIFTVLVIGWVATTITNLILHMPKRVVREQL